MVTFIFSSGGSVTLDAALSERHTGKVTLTKHPVESGVSPADHATVQPSSYSVDGMFTNLPLSATERLARGGKPSSAFDSQGRLLGGGTPGTGPTFVGQMVDVLWAMLGAREAITIKTELRTLPNMVMTSLSMPRTPDVGEAVQFSAEFEEVRFVQTQTVKLAPVQTSVPQKPTAKQQQGPLVCTQPPPEIRTSVYKGGANALGVTTPGSGTPGAGP